MRSAIHQAQRESGSGLWPDPLFIAHPQADPRIMPCYGQNQIGPTEAQPRERQFQGRLL